eukprot:1108745-Lingulodinium_polyedra.AAC.1
MGCSSPKSPARTAGCSVHMDIEDLGSVTSEQKELLVALENRAEAAGEPFPRYRKRPLSHVDRSWDTRKTERMLRSP